MSDFISNVSVHDVPTANMSVAFIESSSVYREDADCIPAKIGDYEYMPWGVGNDLPYGVLSLINSDETLATCQAFNAEVCYGNGLEYVLEDNCQDSTRREVQDFLLHNSLSSYFLGSSIDFKHWGFAVTVLILNHAGDKIVRFYRKHAIYCRFTKANEEGVIENVLFANWRNPVVKEDDVESIPLLDINCPTHDLMVRMGRCIGADGERRVRTYERKFAVLTKIPTADNTYYPLPYYASLFKGKWYNIKQLIGVAKEAKLKNTAPLRYHIEINDKYWEKLLASEGITSPTERQKRILREKQNMIDFITGVENSGKVLFSGVYIDANGNAQNLVRISRIDMAKEGGDWESDIQEAVNMICFTMRVHSNLVGSVPGKAQSNNSGSDKRELYTIAQALQKPYHDLLFEPHRVIIHFNGWDGVRPQCSFIQLTTLDENRDAKVVTSNANDNE